jgi:hypothetical protein
VSEEVNEFLAYAEEMKTAEVDIDEAGVEVPETDAPVEDGQAEGEGEATEGPQYLDLDELGDRLVKIKVDGEIIEVPLSEAANGYQRQSHYTKSMQELAQARAIQQALDNPNTRHQALRLLAERYGQDDPGVGATPQESVDLSDPQAREIHELRNEVGALAAWRAEQLLDSTLDGLQAKYGDLFDAQEVIDAAAARGVTDAGDLEAVFKMIAFDKVAAKQLAAQDVATKRAAEEAARVAAKERLAQTVTSGNGVRGNSVGTAPVAYDSFEAAFEAAAAAAGFD